MSSLNRITLVGEIATDPDLKETTSGDPVLRFKMKSDRPSAEGIAPKTDILDIVIWRDLATNNQDLAKGSIALVEGRIITRTYDDDNGQRHWVTEVEGREVIRLSNQHSNATSDAKSTVDTPPSTPNDVLETKSFDAVKDSDFDFGNKVELKESTELPPQFETPVEEDIPF